MRIAKLFKDEVYKVAADQSSQAFVNKVVGDYYRYALEAIQLLIEEKQTKNKPKGTPGGADKEENSVSDDEPA